MLMEQLHSWVHPRLQCLPVLVFCAHTNRNSSTRIRPGFMSGIRLWREIDSLLSLNEVLINPRSAVLHTIYSTDRLYCTQTYTVYTYSTVAVCAEPGKPTLRPGTGFPYCTGGAQSTLVQISSAPAAS